MAVIFGPEVGRNDVLDRLIAGLDQTESRFTERESERSETQARIDRGAMLEVDDPGRVSARLARLNADDWLVETVLRGERPAVSPRTTSGESTVVALERLIGTNDLMGIAFLQAGADAARCVGRIVLRDGAARVRGYGTGFLVSPRLILTNHHVLEAPADAGSAFVEFNYETDVTGRQQPVSAFALEPARLFVTSPQGDLDYTLVAIVPVNEQGRELAEFGWRQLIEDEGKAILGELVNIIQHPSGEVKQIALRENQIVDLLPRHLHYVTDTAPGSSGSPVFNDQWEVVALHHSGVPRTDDQGNIVAIGGSLWDRSLGEQRIDWVANEGVRISRIVADARARQLDGQAKQLLAELLGLTSSGPPRRPGSPGTPVESAGEAILRVPLEISVRLAGDLAGPQQSPATTEPPSVPTAAAPRSAELDAALAELAASETRVYYDEDGDEQARDQYYAAIDASVNGVLLYEQLATLVRTTHTRARSYKPGRWVYPWVDLRENRMLRSVYSGIEFDPREVIEEDFAMEAQRSLRLAEFAGTEAGGIDGLETALAALEAAFPFNCEHVVPQSWFGKREPMRGDLHHLFTCEWGCNSFRGNTPYFDFADFEEVVRGDCGKREAGRFEPSAGKGSVARATLYYLLRYPASLRDAPTAGDDEIDTLLRERLETLLIWHAASEPEEYERHRNAAIMATQGNRNPLIDHPEWAGRVDFERAF